MAVMLEEGDRGDEFEEPPPDRCPACGGKQFGTYLRGLVQPTLRAGQFDPPFPDDVRFTGCCIDDETPRWFCRNCDGDIQEDGRLIQAVPEQS